MGSWGYGQLTADEAFDGRVFEGPSGCSKPTLNPDTEHANVHEDLAMLSPVTHR